MIQELFGQTLREGSYRLRSMAIFLVVAGIGILIYGLLNVLGFTKEDESKDSAMDKRLFSEKTRYFLGRYYAGFQFIMGGLGAIALGLIFYFGQ